jgi:hypothetical protein
MKTHRIVLSTALFAFVFGILPPEFAQETSSNCANVAKPEQNAEHRAFLIGFVRTINTAEAVEVNKYGSYASWATLLEHQHEGEYFSQWLVRFVPKTENGDPHFGEMPAILPGLSMRLNVHTDGQGYDLLVEDTTDKQWYAAQSDERGIIRECKPLQ